MAFRVTLLGQSVAPPEGPSAALSTSPVDWSGFYVSAHGAILGGSSTYSSTVDGVIRSGAIDLFHAYNLATGSGSQFAGLAAGYNYEMTPRIVVGAEADVSFGAEPTMTAEPYSVRPLAIATVRGRLGYRSHRILYYGTGGFAWSHDQVTTDAATTAFDRAGFTLGGGLEGRLTDRWSAKAEYLYATFPSGNLTLVPGTQFTSDLSFHQVRAGLSYELLDLSRHDQRSDDEPRGIGPIDLDDWSVHGQTTFLSQYAPPFHAPYSGPNSLASNAGRETWDATLYAGRRLWNDAELWINPELDQGYGLSNTLGVAGFTSGEAYKVGYAHPYVRLPRVFVRQTFNLGGETQNAEPGLNQFKGLQTTNRVIVTVGRFSVSDIFDTITYAHDPRNDFMNWTLADAGTFDYAADAWGFTYGAAAEWYEGNWTGRAGLFDLSIVPNSVELDHDFDQYQIVYEIEHRHEFGSLPGRLSLVGYASRGRMGRYDDALALAQQTGEPPNTADVRRYGTRPGVNLNAEQRLTADVNVFGRVGWADGSVEPFEFTDVDRTASAGFSLSGKGWNRPDDTIGVSTIVNDISQSHIAYLAAGGLGILVGDGQLPHPGMEKIVESYYRLPLGSLQVTADYQFIANPGYNRDRGPVSVISLRLRAQF